MAKKTTTFFEGLDRMPIVDNEALGFKGIFLFTGKFTSIFSKFNKFL